MSPMRGAVLIAIATAALCATSAQADVTGHYVYSNHDPALGPPIDLSITVEVSDSGNFRLQLPGVPYHVLSVDGRLYLLNSDPASTQVMRAEDVATILAEHVGDQGKGDLEALAAGLEGKFSWKEIGPTRVGSRDGVGFGLSFDGGPASGAPGLAIASDPALRPLSRPFLEVQSDRYGRFGKLLTIIPPGSKPVFERGGPLQIMFLTLVEADFAPIDANRFTLPAEPMPLDELRASEALFPKSQPSTDEAG